MKHVIDILLSHKASDAMAVKQQQQHGGWTVVQAQTSAQCFATVSGLNDVFPENSVQRGFRYVFLFGGVSIHMYICIDILYLSVVWKRLQSGLQSSEESCTLSWTHLSVCFEVKYFDETLLKQFRMTKLAFQMLWIRLVSWLVRFYAAPLQSRMSFLMRIKEFILKVFIS